MNIQSEVCIVGGGPAGALLGYILAENGISTVVLERNRFIERQFRGEHIDAQGEQLLKKHGLFETIRSYGMLEMKKVEFFDRKQVVKTILPEKNGHVGIHIPQNHLLRAIFQESTKHDHYQLLMNTTVTELIQDDTGAYVGVKAKRDGEEIKIHSAVIVGADGRFSTIRNDAQIPVKMMNHGYDVLWAKIPAPPEWEPSTRMLMVNRQQLALFTQTGGYIQIGWNIEAGSLSALRKQPIESFIQPLLENFPELTESVRQHLQSWKDFVYLKVESCRCETWVKDGLVLIGDAAHTMTPTGAIGINSAMKDADVLAQVLIDAIAESNTSAMRLKVFENSRREEVERQQKQQIEQEASFWKNYIQFSDTQNEVERYQKECCVT
nr:FAD-dependent monooxygenase [Halalkalibacterium ligniniphilum]